MTRIIAWVVPGLTGDDLVCTSCCSGSSERECPETGYRDRPADPVYAGDLEGRRWCDYCGEAITARPVPDDGLDWRRWA